MITGMVNSDLEPTVGLTVRGADGRSRRITAVIDTGFDGWLSLPAALVADLGLVYDRQSCATLADGSEVLFDVYVGTIIWNRRRRLIAIDEADTTPLVGMELLKGFELRVNVERRGRVTIKPLRRRRGNESTRRRDW